MVMEAFDKYWGGVPAIKNVTFQVLPEASTRVAAIEVGRVDIAVQLPFREAVRLESNAQLKVNMYPAGRDLHAADPELCGHLPEQGRRAPPCIWRSTRPRSPRRFSTISRSPCRCWRRRARSGDVPGYTFPFDRKKAAETLEKAGFSKAKPLQMTFCTTNGTFPNDYEMAQAIAAMWRQIGVDVKLEEMTVAKYLELNHSAKLPGIMLYSWANATGDPENYSGRILNPALRFSAWKEPANGERIAKLFAMKLGDERLADYRALNKDASENSWSIPLLQPAANMVTKKTVSISDLFAGLCSAGGSASGRRESERLRITIVADEAVGSLPLQGGGVAEAGRTPDGFDPTRRTSCADLPLSGGGKDRGA